MKIELIQKDNKFAIRTLLFGLIPWYLGYDFGGAYGWWFTKDWMDEHTAKRLYNELISGQKEYDSFKSSKEKTIKIHEF